MGIPYGLGKVIMHEIRGRILNIFDLLADYLFFTSQFLLVEYGIRDDIREDIKAQVEILIEKAAVVTCLLTTGER